ncbi:alpha/beta hydrolase [Pararhodobacter sp. SW119]|uniref:alpha/beta fold hydrolase n=1 Tax=Pararhodobacter sp. SW119 TaxID=2780075 RepID=UPI001AE0B70B|nr:alpha/beta hydrolase [Pararhodobacter sp. SW119]
MPELTLALLIFLLPLAFSPVLIVHARDDRITPFSTAHFTAERIETAEVQTFDTGGHLLLGHHDAVRRRIADFLAAHTQPGGD